MLEAAFYGDDFTGSTDALTQFSRLGLRTALLVTLPSPEELRALADSYDVIGVAGIARSLAPDAQEAEIRPVLTALRDLRPRVVQYKICSTADSSPTLGSLGRALEVGRSIFGPATIPVLAAQPELGRYTVFSHHFATESDAVHRLDRQPTMATHPATPMHESDLRRHLAAQTTLSIGALHLTTYNDHPPHYPGATDNLPTHHMGPTDASPTHHTGTTDNFPTQAARATDDLPTHQDDFSTHYAGATDDVLILDALTDDHLRTIGRAILASADGPPLFTMGSGGLSRALALALTRDEANSEPTAAPPPAAAHQVLVISGSQSARTAEQIQHARVAGWPVLPLTEDAVHQAPQALHARAPGVVVHTTDADYSPADLAEIIQAVAKDTDVRRVVIAGGDTSGRILRELPITALETSPTPHPLAPGLTLCTPITPIHHLNPLQLLLKPGQLGPPNLFTTLTEAPA